MRDSPAETEFRPPGPPPLRPPEAIPFPGPTTAPREILGYVTLDDGLAYLKNYVSQTRAKGIDDALEVGLDRTPDPKRFKLVAGGTDEHGGFLSASSDLIAHTHPSGPCWPSNVGGAGLDDAVESQLCGVLDRSFPAVGQTFSNIDLNISMQKGTLQLVVVPTTYRKGRLYPLNGGDQPMMWLAGPRHWHAAKIPREIDQATMIPISPHGQVLGHRSYVVTIDIEAFFNRRRDAYSWRHARWSDDWIINPKRPPTWPEVVETLRGIRPR